MIWLITCGGRQLVVEAVGPLTWAEVREFAVRELGVAPESLTIEQAAEPVSRHRLQLQWVGHDFGQRPNRRLQVRRGPEAAWEDA